MRNTHEVEKAVNGNLSPKEALALLACQAGADMESGTPVLRGDSLAKFAKLVAAAEREACAHIADSMNYGPCGEYDHGYGDAEAKADERAKDIASDIRARSSAY